MQRLHLVSALAAALLASAVLPVSPTGAQTPPQQPPTAQNPAPAQAPTPPQQPPAAQNPAPPQTPKPAQQPPAAQGAPGARQHPQSLGPPPPQNTQRGRSAVHPEPPPHHPAAQPAAKATEPPTPPAAAPAPHPTKATGILSDDVAVRSLCLKALSDMMQNRPDKLENLYEPPRWFWPFSEKRHFKDRYTDLVGRYGYVIDATYLATVDTEVAGDKDKIRLGRRVFYRVVTSKFMDASYALSFTVVARDKALYLADYDFVEASKAPRKY